MTHSADAEDFVVVEWRAALANAGVPEAAYHLITCPGAAVGGHAKAVSFAQGDVLYGDSSEGGIVVQHEKLAEANDPANLNRHRVAVYEDIDDEDPVELAYLAGVLRHEIEHGKQRDAAQEAFGLYDIVELVASKVAAGDSERERDITNRAPIEADANLMASKHLEKRYPDAVSALLAGPDHYLVDSESAGSDPPSLVARTVEYLWQFRAVCDDPSNLQENRTFADILDNRVPGSDAGARWRELQRAHAEEA